MDYMFKDVSCLSSVLMASNSGAKVISMKSTFENCKSLTNFQNDGFDTNEIIFMYKLFFNSGITNFDGLETNNTEDFSYMFADIKLQNINLSKINTSKAINMSHMFDGCIEISDLDLSALNIV